jgi:hypothetical protein
MDKGDRVWGGNWQAKILSRVRSAGCETLGEFLARFPGESYLKIAERLGDDVAAFQVEWMHFDEAQDAASLRHIAMDSLARDLNDHLPKGWRDGARGDFDTASAYADWVVRLQQKRSDIKPKGKAVWDALEQLRPPAGWSPSGPNDPLIVSAFFKAWSEH